MPLVKYSDSSIFSLYIPEILYRKYEYETATGCTAESIYRETQTEHERLASGEHSEWIFQ